MQRAAQLADAPRAWRSAARCSNPRLLPPSPGLLHGLQRMSPQKPRLRCAGGCSGACGRELVPPGPEAQPQVRVQGWWERGRGVSRAVAGRPRTGEALDTGGDEPVLAPGPSSSPWVDQGAFHGGFHGARYSFLSGISRSRLCNQLCG